MGIWNTGASPIGYAYQSAQGSGINIKPIDPRAFQVDNGSTQRSGRSSGSDTQEKYKAQMGTRTQIENYDLYIENQKSSLQRTFTDKILSESNKDNALKLQQDYVSEMNKLSQQQMNLSVLKQNAEFSYEQQKKVDDIIYTKKINKDIVLEENLANISSGEGIVNMFRQRNSPVAYDVKNDKLMTYEERQDYVNRNSGLDRNMQITDYKAPILKISNSDEANAEVKAIVKGADGNYTSSFDYKGPIAMDARGNLARSYSFDGLQGGFSSDFSDNQGALNEAVENIWNTISEDTKNYAYSTVLGTGIIYETGNNIPVLDKNKKQTYNKKGKPIFEKELDVMSGEDAVKRISVLTEKADKLKNDDPEKEKLLNEANRIGKGIMNTAKGYIRDMAIGDTSGLRKVVSKSTKTINEPTGDGSSANGSKEANEFMATMEGAIPLANALWLKKNGLERWTELTEKNGQPITKFFNIDQSIAKYTTDKLFGITPIELKGKEVTMDDFTNDFFIMNGEYANKNILGTENLKNIKFKKIGGQGYILPKFYNPTNGDNISTEIYQTRNGQTVTTPYVEMIFSAPGNLELGVFENGRKVMKSISEIARKGNNSAYDIKKNGDDYDITILTEINPYEGTNKQSAANLIDNQRVSQEVIQYRSYHNEIDKANNKARLKKIEIQDGKEYIGFHYSKPISKNPSEAFKQLSKPLQGSSNYKLNILQSINDLIESVDDTEKESFRKELMTEYRKKLQIDQNYSQGVEGINW